MSVLLDTHVPRWVVHEPERLSATARRVIESMEIAVSAASLWEMLLKKGRRNEIVSEPIDWWRRHVIHGESRCCRSHRRF